MSRDTPTTKDDALREMSRTQQTLGDQAEVLIRSQAQGQLRTFFDEIKNGTRNYRTVASLSSQVAQEYRGRCVLELLQNAHDALIHAGSGDPRRISFILNSTPSPVLLIANSGVPFYRKDFEGICQLGQSPKDPNESVGNKGLGFRSVLQICTCPEIFSTPPASGQPGFSFRFDPEVLREIESAVHGLAEDGLNACSPFDPVVPLVDWTPKQLLEYCEQLSSAGIDAAKEAREYLSPYIMPLPADGTEPDVADLHRGGHVTVIRLPLDGGRSGTADEAVHAVKEQLERLDERATVFLPHVKSLVIDIDGDQRVLERVVEYETDASSSFSYRTVQLLIGQSRPASGESTTRRFQVWTRDLGGEEHPEQAAQIQAATEHLPNRWPEVRKLVIGVATEDTSEPDTGVFVIFLPTDVTTGTGALVNAPFYGSLSRRHIDFQDSYNHLLLEMVFNLVLDVVADLVSGPPEEWRARAVIDLAASTEMVGGEDWKIAERIREAEHPTGQGLDALPLVLCDHGWRSHSKARIMPSVPADCPVDAGEWRDHAEFDVISRCLEGRLDAVDKLVTMLGGSTSPTCREWIETLEVLAIATQNDELAVNYDGFLRSVVRVLPVDLLSPNHAGQDPLAAAAFLPTHDGRLLSRDDTATLFFQPVRGADDAADFVGGVPGSLQARVAFLHTDVQTLQQEGMTRRNTPVQKFLDERFARSFRREDILRDVVIGALPPIPAAHASKEGELCAELLSWALKLVGSDSDESEKLMPLLGQLPVPCHAGWYAMRDAVFGEGWEGRLGDLLRTLADNLPKGDGQRILGPAMLSPNDPRWPLRVDDRSALLARAGVMSGIRLCSSQDTDWNSRFGMRGYGEHELPSNPPPGVPQDDWDQWRRVVRQDAKPHYDGHFLYELSELRLLPELHCVGDLRKNSARALSELILASIQHWPRGWDTVRLTKAQGQNWSTEFVSPLKFWLTTKPWLRDCASIDCAIEGRWLVPESLLQGQGARYSHLDPLSQSLARRLLNEPALREVLTDLGLSTYPIEDDQIGPELLNALADAQRHRRIPSERFDVFVGQLRDAWRHLDSNGELPSQYMVRTGRRSLSVHRPDALDGVYLPDHGDRARALTAHGIPMIEMLTRDAIRLAAVLVAHTPVRRASALDERVLIDDVSWTGDSERARPMSETRYAWMAPVLLTIAAHGGARPGGAATRAWGEALERLRRARVIECESIAVQIVDHDDVIAFSEPAATWLPGEILAVRRDSSRSYGELSAATQAILDRSDLSMHLRLVLDGLSGLDEPTPEQIEKALNRAEIDADALADVRQRWDASTSILVDRIRPVLSLLGIAAEGLDAAASNDEHLKQWLSDHVPQWAATELVASARRSRDDLTMGRNAWETLGEIAQLPLWNDVLSNLGSRYATVVNSKADEQIATHIEEAMPYLRALTRHVAANAGRPELFLRLEKVHQQFSVPLEWAARWWEVPLAEVINKLKCDYEQEGMEQDMLGLLCGIQSIGDLAAAIEAHSISVEPDPFETARLNKAALASVVDRVVDLHRVWLALRSADSTRSESAAPDIEIGPTAYLQRWSEVEVLAHALQALGESDFISACEGCTSPEEISERLGLDPEAVDVQREERIQQQQHAERQRRTFDVAGVPFEVGASSYQELFDQVCELPPPEGPQASDDVFSPLASIGPASRGARGGKERSGKSSHRRPSSELRELIGIVGEMHALRFLRAKFGVECVTLEAWVSENRLKARPPVPGEPEDASDGLGFDFRFRQGKKTWHVEVKATRGDEPQFDLGISEIQAASRFANDRQRPWRILRITQALDETPGFEWLPNPFDDKYRMLFLFQKGGMKVSYLRDVS